MGYYSGNGETTGGGSDITIFATYIAWGTPHTIYQRRNSATTRKNGVSLATAQGTEGNISMSDHEFQPGYADRYLAVLSKGTKSTVTYSQISGSNLYELDVTTDNYAVKKDSGSWQT